MHPAQQAAQNRQGQHEMSSLAQAIQWTHKAIRDLSDPQAKAQVTAALGVLTRVQALAHKPLQGMGQAGGGPPIGGPPTGGGPPSGP